MTLVQVVNWVAGYADKLGAEAILLLVGALMLYAFVRERIVLGTLYQSTCTELQAERESKEALQASLADTRVLLATAAAHVETGAQRRAELTMERDVCEREREWLRSSHPAPSPSHRPHRPRRGPAT